MSRPRSESSGSDSSFGAELRSRRLAARLTQEDLAERAGVSPRTVSQLERSQGRAPRQGTVTLLADALGLVGPDRDGFLRAGRDGYWRGRAAGLPGDRPGEPTEPGGPIRAAPVGPPGTALRRSAPGGPPDRDGREQDPAGPPGAPAARPGDTATPAPAQLPADVRGFAGRSDQLGRLDALLTAVEERPTAVVISALAGTAGVGKTALAVHWAHRVRDHFPDGQLYINLRGFDPSGSVVPPAEALRRFLDALDVPPHLVPAELDALAARYRTLVAGRRLLVVLDNARDADQVRPLLPGTPTALVVVTSRRRLTSLVAAEAAHLLPLDLLGVEEARELLRSRLGAARVEAEPGAAEQLVARCAGLPLALAILAARAATRPQLSLGALADQLRCRHDRLDVLSTGDAASTDLRAVFSWSYRALDEESARLFRLLGRHLGPDISVPAAAGLAAVPVDRARRSLQDLSAAHLVVEHLPGRYTFHDLLRAYAADLSRRHDEEHEVRAALHRLLDHYTHTAHAATLLMHPSRDPIALPPPRPGAGPEVLATDDRAMAWFTAEHQVLLSAVRHAAGLGFDTHTWQLAWALADFLDRKGHWHDQVGVQRAALGAARRLSHVPAQAFAHRLLGIVHSRLDEVGLAHEEFGRALDRYGEIGDHTGLAHTHLTAASAESDPGRALRRAQRALELYRVAGHRKGEGDALNAVGWYHARLGDTAQALVHCEQALTLLRTLGDHDGEAATWDSIGYAQYLGGHHDAAVRSLEKAVELNRHLGNRHDEGTGLGRLGDVHRATGDVAAARRAYRQAVDVLVDIDPADAARIGTALRRLDAEDPPGAGSC